METMTERQTIALSSGSWLVGRLLEYRGTLGLPELDRTMPFLVAMPLGTDGALMTSKHGVYALGNMHGGPVLDLPVDDGGAFGPLRAGTPVERSDNRRQVAIADCHDTGALFIEASRLMNADNRISDDTHACNVDAVRRMTRPHAEVFAPAE